MDNSALYDKLGQVFRKPIETERLIIHPIRKTDAYKLAVMFNVEGGDFQMHTYGFDHYDADRIPLNARFANFLRKSGEEHHRRVGYKGLFAYSKDSQDFIGRFTLWHDEKRRVRLSPYFLPSARQKGLCAEGYEATLLRAVGAGLFPQGEIVAEVSVNNVASQKFFLAHHFKQTGEPAMTSASVSGNNRLCIPLVRSLL